MVKFLRRVWRKYSKLGRKRKKKQVWRKPKGRDNKMREKRKGCPAVVSIGYKKEKQLRGKINEKKQIIVNNINELENVGKNNLIIIGGNVGKKKKIEIITKAEEKKIEIHNLNTKKFLKKNKLKNKKENGNKK